MKLACLTVVLFLFLSKSFCQSGNNYTEITKVNSPDGKLIIQIYLKIDMDGKNKPFYLVNYNNQQIILPSALGVNSYFDNVSVKEILTTFKDTAWHPVYGEHRQITDRYNQSVIRFSKPGAKEESDIVIRAYNEGIAFRYHFPEQPAGKGGRSIQINKENTRFAFADSTGAWFTSHAQGEYRYLPLAGWPGEAERPLTLFLKNGLYACIGEAGLVNFSRTKFMVKREIPGAVLCNMYDGVDELAPFATPWRFVMVAETPGNLLANNYFILNLNEPCKIDDVSWIKPGKIMREVTLSTSGAKRLVDFAVKHHLQYIHFDAGWYGYEYQLSSDATKWNVDTFRSKQSLDLPEVISYAKKNKIGVWLYVNQLALSRQLDSILPLYQSWGISGVKFGFVEVGSFRWTTWLHEAVKKCAQYHLMVDIHDEYRPTGFSRTYPNLLTQEGVRGNEEMPDATSNTVLPFTRFIAGPADYTLCYFDKRIKTTHAHQLALAAIYYSPLQFLYWYDKSFKEEYPELEFWDKIPTVWDDTKVLKGEIGKYIIVARRSSAEWFIGAITNNEERQMSIPMNFLEPEKKYVACIYTDDTSKLVTTVTKVAVDSFIVTSGSLLKLQLLPGGGAAIHIRAVTGNDLKTVKVLSR